MATHLTKYEHRSPCRMAERVSKRFKEWSVGYTVRKRGEFPLFLELITLKFLRRFVIFELLWKNSPVYVFSIFVLRNNSGLRVQKRENISNIFYSA